jgi:NAD-dependent dihydropyrimidine dehydrogenase PreA subunit
VIEKIDEILCINCGLCENICPTDVLRGDDKTIHIAYPDDCCNCMECLFICPTDAVLLNTKIPRKFDSRLRWNQIKEDLQTQKKISKT